MSKLKLYLTTQAAKGPLEVVRQVLKLNRRLDSKRREFGLEYQAQAIIQSVDFGGVRIEESGTYTYPTTLEVKIESHSNWFFSVRVVDGRWVSEGRNLDGPGRSIGQVYRLILRELKEHAVFINQSKLGGQDE
jgi:hypothetical protein